MPSQGNISLIFNSSAQCSESSITYVYIFAMLVSHVCLSRHFLMSLHVSSLTTVELFCCCSPSLLKLGVLRCFFTPQWKFEFLLPTCQHAPPGCSYLSQQKHATFIDEFSLSHYCCMMSWMILTAWKAQTLRLNMSRPERRRMILCFGNLNPASRHQL